MHYDYTKKEVCAEPQNTNCNGYLNTYNIEVPSIHTVYFFRRGPLNSEECNPIPKALLSANGWSLANKEETYPHIIKELIKYSKPLQNPFDVVLTVKTDNELLSAFYNQLKTSIQHDIERIIGKEKESVKDIVECRLPDNFLRWAYDSEEEYLKVIDEFDKIMDKMFRDNKDTFAFRYFKGHPNRNEICDFYDSPFWGSSVSELHKDIDGKDVLILDDTIESGAMWSRWAEMTWRMFEPNNITIANFFTPEEGKT